MLRLPPPLSFWIHSYLSKRRRYGGICLHFPYMIERDFLEIVAVKLKRHSVVGGGKCINLCGYILLPPEIYIAEILYVCRLEIWRKCIFLALLVLVKFKFIRKNRGEEFQSSRRWRFLFCLFFNSENIDIFRRRLKKKLKHFGIIWYQRNF